jgi:hypothetical protein
MRKVCASKQCHEGGLERSQALKEIGQSPFSTDRIADQQSQKINGFIGAKASAHQTDLMRKGGHSPLRRQVLDSDDVIARTTQVPRDDPE